MYITKRQSQLIAAAILIAFFTVSFMVMRQSKRNIPGAAEPTSELPQVTAAPQATLTSEPAVDGAAPSATTTPAPGSSAGMSIPVVLKEFKRSEVKDGRILWEVEATRGVYLPLQSQADLEQAQLHLHKEDGSSLKLSSQRAKVRFNGQSLGAVELSGNVQAWRSEQGRTPITMQTERAAYDAAASQVTSDAAVEITGDLFVVTGNGLEADTEKQIIKILSNVHSVITPRASAELKERRNR